MSDELELPKIRGFMVEDFRETACHERDAGDLIIHATDVYGMFFVQTKADREVFEDLYCPYEISKWYTKATTVKPWVVVYISGEVMVYFVSRSMAAPLETFVKYSPTIQVLTADDYVKVRTAQMSVDGERVVGTDAEFIPKFASQVIMRTRTRLLHFNSTYYNEPHRAIAIPNVTNADEVVDVFSRCEGAKTVTLNDGTTWVFLVQPLAFAVSSTAIRFAVCEVNYSIPISNFKTPYGREAFVGWLRSAQTMVIDVESVELQAEVAAAAQTNAEIKARIAEDMATAAASRREIDANYARGLATRTILLPPGTKLPMSVPSGQSSSAPEPESESETTLDAALEPDLT